jgi:hypothetical protein
MMHHCNDTKFIGGDLIDDAVGKSAEKIAASGATKDCTGHWISQNKICRSLKLGRECEAELDIRPRCIESRSIMQLGKRGRNNNELHFKAART